MLLLEKMGEEFYNTALDQIAGLKDIKSELNEILKFYESTLKAQQHVKVLFKPDLSIFNKDLCSSRNSEGLPLLRAEDIEIDQDLVNKILEDIYRIIRNQRGEAVPAYFDSSSLADQQKVLIKGLVEDGIILERLACDLKIDYPVFYFLINHAFSPFISKYGEKLGEFVDTSNWLRGNCPVCGKEPLVVRLEEETGRRWLFCSLCHSEWLFKRLVCPFCENNDQESLRYFFVENEQAHRIDVCEKCKRYIKTIDCRKIDSGVNLFVENLSTLVLDIVADKEGYRGSDIFLFREK